MSHLPNKPPILKEFTSYYKNPFTKSGYEDIKTYYYGLYIKLPNDTTGVANEIIDFLRQKAKAANERDAIHLWIFTDSTIIPKSFNGEWSTKKMRSKCFAHALKLANGNFAYDFDIFMEFKR